jgi:hypothetical protein
MKRFKEVQKAQVAKVTTPKVTVPKVGDNDGEEDVPYLRKIFSMKRREMRVEVQD